MSYYQAEQPYNTPGTKNDRPNVVFYSEAKPDAAATKKDGLPRFKDIELCRVTFPADRARTLIRPAHAEWTKDRGQIVTYAMRFPEEYKRFKAGQGPVVRGTPVSEAPFLRESQRQMLRALECYTIEQLAGLEGNAVKNLGPGGREMVEQARAFLAAASGTANVTALAAENAKLRQDLELLRAGQAMAATEAPAVAPPSPTAGDPFEAMDDEQLKDFISEKAGQRPKGNPNRQTLLVIAREVAKDAA